ncbi:hypothetical protein [Microbulbifer magnicolonia]|uniref:hypothetical protein n=1 Tax=Microbulbifer magnicolonia TaxID=3109744 RepID=UPI002B402467|nr:hypothetical protein [Microbulbifer sp. GG15]
MSERQCIYITRYPLRASFDVIEVAIQRKAITPHCELIDRTACGFIRHGENCEFDNLAHWLIGGGCH